MRARVLLLEKDGKNAEQIQTCLAAKKHQVTTLDPDELTPDAKLSNSYDAVLFAEDSCSLSVAQLRETLDLDNHSSFLILLGTAPPVDRVVDSMLEGIHAYLTKPVNGPRLQGVLENGLENQKTLKDIMQMATQVQESNRQLQNHKRTLLREKRQLEQRTTQLHFLHELSLAMNASLERQQVVKQVFTRLQDELQVKWCRARLNYKDNGEPGWEYAVGLPEESLEILSLSLAAGGKSLGTMEVALPTRMSQEYRQLFDTIALQVALALQNASHHAEVKRLADYDGLTRLNNRRSFERQLQRELARHHRYQDELSLILWDIDHFKKINDLYGHQSGDEVLRRMGRLMQETFRNCDYVARWGGDEFAAILPRTPREKAFHSAERLRRLLQQQVFNSSRDIQISASFGVADTRSISSDSEEELIAMADQALYKAKKAGRNRIKVCKEFQQGSCHSALEAREICLEEEVRTG